MAISDERGLHFDGADVVAGAQAIGGFVADVRDAGDDLAVVVGDDEAAALVGHAAAHHRRVGGAEQGDVGVGQRQVVLVNHHALEAVLGLVGALHIDIVIFAQVHLDGIKTYDLANGFRNRFVLDMGCNSEVFQFVVDKHDLMVAGLLLDILQRVTHRHVLEIAGDALRVCYACQGAQQ